MTIPRLDKQKRLGPGNGTFLCGALLESFPGRREASEAYWSGKNRCSPKWRERNVGLPQTNYDLNLSPPVRHGQVGIKCTSSNISKLIFGVFTIGGSDHNCCSVRVCETNVQSANSESSKTLNRANIDVISMFCFCNLKRLYGCNIRS